MTRVKERIPNGDGSYTVIHEDYEVVNILGVEYKVFIRRYGEEKVFERRSIAGYHDGYAKEIVCCDMSTYKGWENEQPETILEAQKSTLRHEIVHAFFHESGLSNSSLMTDIPWAKNEEMVDWFANQGPKIYKAWQEVGAL